MGGGETIEHLPLENKGNLQICGHREVRMMIEEGGSIKQDGDVMVS